MATWEHTHIDSDGVPRPDDVTFGDINDMFGYSVFMLIVDVVYGAAYLYSILFLSLRYSSPLLPGFFEGFPITPWMQRLGWFAAIVLGAIKIWFASKSGLGFYFYACLVLYLGGLSVATFTMAGSLLGKRIKVVKRSIKSALNPLLKMGDSLFDDALLFYGKKMGNTSFLRKKRSLVDQKMASQSNITVHPGSNLQLNPDNSVRFLVRMDSKGLLNELFTSVPSTKRLLEMAEKSDEYAICEVVGKYFEGEALPTFFYADYRKLGVVLNRKQKETLIWLLRKLSSRPLPESVTPDNCRFLRVSNIIDAGRPIVINPAKSPFSKRSKALSKAMNKFDF